ncbi:hypothetical protein QC763_600435 [Podospora pseudopauciseta]|uniref:F-box domain-containing protein n=1 Tax=Podospora pseudopauciseta TaxID=2093780 RepID=A0ABR0H4Y2_9PEZI|nr:hypothetical protein QC763_600435 [Podospora pseudopauciseta]
MSKGKRRHTKRWRYHHRRPKANPNYIIKTDDATPVLTLPMELFVKIGKYLTQAEAMAFGAACKQVGYMLRPAIWQSLVLKTDSHARFGEELGRIVARAKAELDRFQRYELPCRPFVEDVKNLNLYLQHHDPLDREEPHHPELANKILDLLSLLPNVQNLNLDLRDLQQPQVAHLITLLGINSTPILPQARQVRFTTGEHDHNTAQQRRSFDPITCGRVIAAVCRSLGPHVTDFEFIRGTEQENNEALLEVAEAFTNGERKMKKLLVASTDSMHGFDMFGAREILEQIVAPHRESIEEIFIGDDAEWEPEGGREEWREHYGAVDHIVGALEQMPNLKRVAFPVVDFRCEGVRDMAGDENFAREEVEKEMRRVVGAVMDRLPNLDHVAFWSQYQEMGVEAWREGDGEAGLGWSFHEVRDDWIRPRSGRGAWPMGIWGRWW